jgi:hypothetical protein
MFPVRGNTSSITFIILVITEYIVLYGIEWFIRLNALSSRKVKQRATNKERSSATSYTDRRAWKGPQGCKNQSVDTAVLFAIRQAARISYPDEFFQKH